MSDKRQDLINKVTDSLKDAMSGRYPTSEEIMLEMARRTLEALDMYAKVAHELALERNTRP